MATSVAVPAQMVSTGTSVVSRSCGERQAPMRLCVNMGRSGKSHLITYTTRSCGGDPESEEIQILEGDILLLRTKDDEYFRVICDKDFILHPKLVTGIQDIFLAHPQGEIEVTSLPERLRRMLGDHATMVCSPESWEALISIWPTNAQIFKQLSVC